MSETPLASIVVITYNQEHSLPVTLDSLLAQNTSFPFEIVVGDDCSKDRTRAVIADYAERFPDRVRPVYNKRNLGILGNYVSTLSHCKGKYISGCGTDCGLRIEGDVFIGANVSFTNDKPSSL